MRVAIAGSSGFIGTALVKSLEARGDHVVRLVRRAVTDTTHEIEWHPDRGQLEANSLEGFDAVVNLAGEGIASKRWTAAQKNRIVDSRVATTSLLARAITEQSSPPSVLVNGSAIGFYGNGGDVELDETSPSGQGFLADVVRQWEAAADKASRPETRVAFARTGMVLDAGGGSLAKMLLPFKLGAGGRLGSGRQWMSWITLSDHVRALCWLLDHRLEGPVNLVAPNPVTNAEFTRALGHALHRPTILPTPKLALHTLLGRELVDELLFTSQRVLPRALTASGFEFEFPAIEAALGTSIHK